MRRWIPVTAVAAVVVLALTGAGLAYQNSQDDGSGPIAVAVPPLTLGAPGDAGDHAFAECSGLVVKLPVSIDKQQRRKTTPPSDLTAAWGSIKLRCGIPKPVILDPASPKFDMTAAEDAPAQWINGVSWVGVEGDGGYTFTTTGRDVYVEVWCPSKGAGGINTTDPLVDLAAVIVAHTERADGAGPGPDPQTKTY